MKFSRGRKGFTLPELLVVIGIMGMLMAIIFSNLVVARAKARDVAKRQSMREMENALDVYYTNEGHYPLSDKQGHTVGECNTDGRIGWEIGGNKGQNSWVPGLAPKYIAELPYDPIYSTHRECFGYTNAYYYKSCDGENYGLVFFCSMESAVPPSDPFYDPARYYPPQQQDTTLRICRGDIACYKTIDDQGWGRY